MELSTTWLENERSVLIKWGLPCFITAVEKSIVGSRESVTRGSGLLSAGLASVVIFFGVAISGKNSLTNPVLVSLWEFPVLKVETVLLQGTVLWEKKNYNGQPPACISVLCNQEGSAQFSFLRRTLSGAVYDGGDLNCPLHTLCYLGF